MTLSVWNPGKHHKAALTLDQRGDSVGIGTNAQIAVPVAGQGVILDLGRVVAIGTASLILRSLDGKERSIAKGS